MTKSLDDLKAAFAGESQANRRYLAYAKKADEEGQPQLARLYRAAAQAETVHAHNHLKAMGEIKTSAENIQVAINGENYEVVSMYPAFIKDAESEDEKHALKSFRWALEVEKQHEAFFREAQANLDKETENFDYYVCPFCGSTHARNAPERCPVCGAAKEKFVRIS